MHRSSLAYIAGLAALVAACLPVAAMASVVTITSNDTNVSSRTTQAGFQQAFFSGTDIPASTLLSVSAPPGISTNQITYSEQNGQTVFSNSLSATRDGSVGSLSGANATLLFSVSQDTHYALTGWFGIHDNGSTGVEELDVQLYDLDESLPDYQLFWNDQISRQTVDERFELGETGGDRANGGLLKGSLQGTLLAGHSYRYYFNTASSTNLQADAGTRSEGLLTLTLDTPNQIPEPGSLALLLAAGLAAGMRRSGSRDRSVQALIACASAITTGNTNSGAR